MERDGPQAAATDDPGRLLLTEAVLAPQVHTATIAAGRTMRWSTGARLSLRSYDFPDSQQSDWCVSTRSTELTLVLEGELQLEVGPARQHVRVRSGEAVLVTQGVPHNETWSAGSRALVVDLSLPKSARPGLGHLPSAALAPELTRLIPHLWEVRPGALERLGRLLDAGTLAAPREGWVEVEDIQSTRLMARVKADLEARFREPVQLSALARRYHLDPFYLARNFKRNFGLGPSAYLQFLRLEDYLWSRVLGRRLTETERALEAGFGDYSTFCRRIRQTFGQPPSRLFSRSG